MAVLIMRVVLGSLVVLFLPFSAHTSAFTTVFAATFED